MDALTRHPAPGRVARLTAAQRAQIPGFLERGAAAYGLRGDVWTATRVATVIEQEFGVRSARDHVSALLRRLGWSRQRPIERATQRNAEAIRQWSEERWPALKKGRTNSEPPSSGETNPPSICCPWRCAPGRHAGRRPSCAVG